MSIDGISGPKGPGSAPKIDAVAPGEATEAVEASARLDDVAGAEAAEAPLSAGAVDVIEAADAVSEDLRVGAVSDVDEAVEVMLERIVETRYGNLSPSQQQAFTSQLRQLAQDDPVFGEQLRLMIGAARGAEASAE